MLPEKVGSSLGEGHPLAQDGNHTPSHVREAIDLDSIFFSPISWDTFQKLKKWIFMKSGKSIVDQAALTDFNAYTRQYSVQTIADQMLAWLADRVQSFMARHA
jgi:hypothetical protein